MAERPAIIAELFAPLPPFDNQRIDTLARLAGPFALPNHEHMLRLTLLGFDQTCRLPRTQTIAVETAGNRIVRIDMKDPDVSIHCVEKTAQKSSLPAAYFTAPSARWRVDL